MPNLVQRAGIVPAQNSTFVPPGNKQQSDREVNQSRRATLERSMNFQSVNPG